MQWKIFFMSLDVTGGSFCVWGLSLTANFVRGAKEALELKGLAVVAHGEAVAVASVGEDGEEEGEQRAAEQRGPVGGQPAVVGAGHLGAVAGAAVGVVGGQPPGLQGGGAP